MRAGKPLFYWPDVLLGIVVFVAGFWAAGATLFLSILLVGEQRHASSDPSALELLGILVLAVGCLFAGSQIMVSRRVGFDVAIAAGLLALAWLVLTGIWSPLFWTLPALLVVCVLRRILLSSAQGA